jgi:hypothetical protein
MIQAFIQKFHDCLSPGAKPDILESFLVNISETKLFFTDKGVARVNFTASADMRGKIRTETLFVGLR